MDTVQSAISDLENAGVTIDGFRAIDSKGNVELFFTIFGVYSPGYINITKGMTGKRLRAVRLYAKFLYLIRYDSRFNRHTKLLQVIKNLILGGDKEPGSIAVIRLFTKQSPAANPSIEKHPEDETIVLLFNSLPRKDQKKSLIYLRFLVATKSWKDGFIQKTVKKVAKFAAFHL